MRAVILLDRPFARRERSMLARLEVGLADEGVRVIHAVPKVILGNEPVSLYSRTVGYDPSGFPIPLRVRARTLAGAIDDAIGDSESGHVDIVHAFAPSVWRLGLETARLLGAVPLLEIWSRSAAAHAAETLAHPARPVLSLADPNLREGPLAAARPAADRLVDVPWGVHGQTIDRAALEGDRAVAVMLLADAAHATHLNAALHGFAAACSRDPRLMGFINTERAHGHAIWRTLRRLNLTDRVSLIPDAEARRDTILRLDALVVPEPSGRMRSMMLDAMASGMPLLAAADPSLSIGIDSVSARLIPRADAALWESAFLAVATGDPSIQRLRDSAAAWVTAHRTASDHVSAVLRLYERIAASHATAAVHAA